MKGLPLSLASALLLVSASGLRAAEPPRTPAPKPDVATGLEHGRERLARYQWHLKTQMWIDESLRLQKVEIVTLGPDGGLVTKKTVRYDKSPSPTPFPENDPRFRLARPLGDVEETSLGEAAMDLMQLYARLSPARLRSWAARADLRPADPERPGQVQLHGRGLGRPQDDAVLFLDVKDRAVLQIEVKTTVRPEVKDLAFIRAVFEPLPAGDPAAEGLRIPKKIFLNMNAGPRHVVLEMETTDYRSWP